MLLPSRRLVHLLLFSALVACAHAPAPGPAPDAGVEAEATATALREFNVLGAENAPVAIIEFTDLQCPYCARFALTTFPQLKQAYIDTGKVRYASRDLPLSMHRHAIPAAVATRCAGEQGKFWEYRHAVFGAQDRLGAQAWDELAGELGLDPARFVACRNDGRQLSAVRADAALAASYGLDSTPSFVVGRVVDGKFVGDSFSGVISFDDFSARINALLQ